MDGDLSRPSGCGQVRVVKLRRRDEPRRRRWPALPAARRGDPRRGTRPGPANNQVPGNQAPRSRAEGMRILPAGRQIIPRFTVCCGHGNLNRTAAQSEPRRDNVDALVLAPASTAVAQSHRQIGDAHRPAGFHSVPVLTNPRNAGEAARNCNATYRGFRLCDWQTPSPAWHRFLGATASFHSHAHLPPVHGVRCCGIVRDDARPNWRERTGSGNWQKKRAPKGPV